MAYLPCSPSVFNDFLHVLARTRKSSLQDDVDVMLGKPAKGFFNRETLEVEQLLAATGREGRFTLVKRVSPLLCLHWEPWQRCF